MVQEGGRDLCCIVKQVFIFLDHRKTRLEHWGGARSPQEFCGFRFNCPLSRQYHRLLSAPRPLLVVLRMPSHMSWSVGSWPATIATKVAKPAPPLVVNSSTGCGLRAKIECLDPVHSKNDQTVWLSWFQDRALYSSIFLRILRVNSQASPERKCVRNHGICTNRVVGNLAIKVQNFWESFERERTKQTSPDASGKALREALLCVDLWRAEFRRR